MNNSIRVRFAPSPTGFLHIGGARTALFNWLYAKSQGGKFILRIEDTDKERSKDEYLQEILESMKWLGLNWDEFYKQSDRFSIYQEYAKKLLDEGKAYKDGEAVILKMPSAQQIKLFELIRGEIQFDSETIKDQVLMKSDGSPTYSFACVIDDALMEVSHVIRGEDHISNTPKQIVIYQALEFKVPKFAHLPLILDEEGGRMSKRAGAVAATDYKTQGFLPEAIVNYLSLLGWSPGNDQEVIGRSELVEKFELERVLKTGAIFSQDKLEWLNGQYLRKMAVPELTDALIPYLSQKGWWDAKGDRAWLERLVKLHQERIFRLSQFTDLTAFFFEKDLEYNDEASRELKKDPRLKGAFLKYADLLHGPTEFEAKVIEEKSRALMKELGMSGKEFIHPCRVALTGRAVSPGFFETVALLGKTKAVERLKKAAGL